MIGDALHYMPPVGGMGGNAALYDASVLCAALTSVNNGEVGLARALRTSEEAILANGFGAVRAAVWYTRLAISRMPGVRAFAKGFFRACGRVTPLRRAIFGGDAA